MRVALQPASSNAGLDTADQHGHRRIVVLHFLECTAGRRLHLLGHEDGAVFVGVAEAKGGIFGHHRAQRIHRIVGRVLLDALGQRLESVFGEREQDVLLVSEIGIDRHRRIADHLGQLADGQAFIAFLLHQLMGCGHKFGSQGRFLLFATCLRSLRQSCCLSRSHFPSFSVYTQYGHPQVIVGELPAGVFLKSRRRHRRRRACGPS